MNHVLTWIVFLPALVASVILLLPNRLASMARPLALFASAVVAVMTAIVWGNFEPHHAFAYWVKVSWIPELGINFELAADGWNLPLLLLTGLLTPLAFLACWNSMEGDATKLKRMAALVLVMETGALGTFLSQDLVLFYVFWEIILIPAYLLIGIYGGPGRRAATLQFLFYTLAGSLLMLLGIAWILYQQSLAGLPLSASIGALQDVVVPFAKDAPLAGLLSPQGLLFLAFGAAFFVKSPLFPLHGWLAATYREAPPLVTIYLAAILSKMGTYGVLKILLPLCPNAVQAYAPALSWLAAIGIVYGALLALAQTDMKSLIAYSSLSHVSYILLGLFSLRETGMGGALLQMVNHGITIAGLFMIVDWLEQRRGALGLSDFGGWAKRTPVLAVGFFVLVLSSVALPGTNSFVGEFMILLGSFRTHVGPTSLAALGIVLGAVYMLTLYQKTMFGPASGEVKATSDLSVVEGFVLASLIVFIFAIGIAPQPYLARSREALEQTSRRLSTATSVSDLSMPRQAVNSRNFLQE